MKASLLLVAAVLFMATPVLAGDPGPTHPDKARQHPLDSSEPRQEIIEQQHDDMRKPRLPADEGDLDPSLPERLDPEGEPSTPVDDIPADTNT